MARFQPPKGWERPVHEAGNVFIKDIPGVGRYLMRKPKVRELYFRLFLNGGHTVYTGTPEQLAKTVERIIAHPAHKSYHAGVRS